MHLLDSDILNGQNNQIAAIDAIGQPSQSLLGAAKIWTVVLLILPDRTSMPDETTNPKSGSPSLWRIAQLVCLGIILLSVLSCVALAAIRSIGLTHVTVTALDKSAEPRDHNLPFVKQKEALPDYTIAVNTTSRQRIDLGAKPNESAIAGLTWQLPDPISTCDVASIRLNDQDKILSDAIAEVQITDDSVTTGNYRFEFVTERSFSVGVQSFFKTPVGRAIAVAFTIAVLMMILSVFAI